MRALVTALTGVLLLAAVHAAQARDMRVVVHNAADEALYYLYIKSQGSSAWLEDMLGEDIIPPGGEVRIDLEYGDGYCLYDFEVEFESGRRASEYGANVCEIKRFSFR